MYLIKVNISIFFLTCLFNVAFIPQFCLNAVEELKLEESKRNGLDEQSGSDINIIEEESKESSEENREEDNSYSLKESMAIFAWYKSALHSSLGGRCFPNILYQSISLLQITPPPKELS